MTETSRFVRFLLVGAVNTAFGYTIYGGALLLGCPVAIAVGLSTLLGIIFNFHSYGGLVFGQASWRRLGRFTAVYGVIFMINLGGLTLLAAAGIGPLAGQALLLPVLALASFVGLRRFVYQRNNPHPAQSTLGDMPS